MKCPKCGGPISPSIITHICERMTTVADMYPTEQELRAGALGGLSAKSEGPSEQRGAKEADGVIAGTPNTREGTSYQGSGASPTAQGWISVREKLPEGSEVVLVVVAYDDTPFTAQLIKDKNGKRHWYSVAEYVEIKGDAYLDGYFETEYTRVTHWMPLPPPPSVDAKGEGNN